MRHAIARKALAGILTEGIFARRATAIAQAAMVGDQPGIDAEIASSALAAALALPSDEMHDTETTLGGLALPDSCEALAAQLGELLMEYPSCIGQGLGTIQAMVELWPHAARAERVRLRRAWYRGLRAGAAPDGSYATRRDLCEWQSRQPTIHDDDTPAADALTAMMGCRSAERAYHMLAAHLGPDTPVPRLCCILGVLTGRIMLHRFDRQGLVVNAMWGANALRGLSDQLPLATSLVLLSQLGHRVWWCRHRAGLKALEPGCPDRQTGLTAAVRTADATAAQRAARLAAGDPESFWRRVGELFTDQLAHTDTSWTRSLTAILVAARRADGNPPGPDDAAALATTLATVTWLSPSCPSV